MGGLGPGEIAVIVVILLLVFGAKKLPDIGKSIGKGLKEFKKATKEFSNPLNESLYGDDSKPQPRKVAAPDDISAKKADAEPAKEPVEEKKA
ncbi:MAG: twin-arginine translocase TatA/TatE family subunit [Spirochaetota bacterium]|nr:twin-arginine translocase TatA/TatE family subunit [Spirochaetota bacterium]